MGSTQYLESLCPLSNTLAHFPQVSQPGDIEILNTVDPLALVSKHEL